MPDESYAPKPLPTERVIGWPTRAAWWVQTHLSWPWQVREMKRAGFRRIGWMTWETRPDSELTDDQRAFISRRLGEL